MIVEEHHDDILRGLIKKYGEHKFYVIYASSHVLDGYNKDIDRSKNIEVNVRKEIEFMKICDQRFEMDTPYSDESGKVTANFFCK